MENLEFTDDEIREQLAALGYFDVSQTRLRQFRRDLHRLVEHDRSSGSSSWFTEITSPSTNSDVSPTGQRQLGTKPGLSRYQPHLKVSPRAAQMSRSTRQTRDPSFQDYTMSSDADTSPGTRVKTLATEFHGDLAEGADPVSPWGRETADDPVHTATLLRRYDDRSGEREAESRSPWRHHDDQGAQSRSPWRERSINEGVTDDHTHEMPSTSYARHDDATEQTPDTPVDMTFPDPRLSSENKRIIRRRKVMRKQTDGSSAIFDESLVADSENGQSFRMHDISVDDMNVQYDRVHLPPTLPSRPHTAKPSWRKSPDRESVREQPLPSWIRPNTSHPHTRNIRKTDPVNRYHQYKDSWNTVKAPGEKSHSVLRWEVRGQMMYKDEPQPRPQKMFVPNNYVVPTSKKRSALRWEVRHALERGLPVPSTFTVL